jgi:hypothetical protein
MSSKAFRLGEKGKRMKRKRRKQKKRKQRLKRRPTYSLTQKYNGFVIFNKITSAIKIVVICPN